MQNLSKQDFEKLNNDFIYVAKRKFNVDLANDISSLYISDVLISLYFEGYRNSSKIGISLVGSFVGQTVINYWKGKWVTNTLSLAKVGQNQITVNPFSIAHQRLTKGINKSLYSQIEIVGAKANFDNVEDFLDKEKIRIIFNGLFDEGWWPISKIYKKNLPNYVRYEMAYILGMMAKYIHDKDYIKSKFEELVNDEENMYYAFVAFQNCLFSNFVDKILNIIDSEGYSKNLKIQAIASLKGAPSSEKYKIMEFCWQYLMKTKDPILKFYTGNVLGSFDDSQNIEWINNKLLDQSLDEFTKLALLVAIQLLRKKEFIKNLLSLLFYDNTYPSVKDEIIKTLCLLPVNQEIELLNEKYDQFDDKSKIGFINLVLFSNFNKKKELLSKLLNREKNSFVKSYILSALDSIETLDDSNSF